MAIGELAVRYDAFVVTDEVYEHMVYAPNHHTCMASLPGMYEHMRKHAAILRPKFEKVEDVLEKEIGGLGIFLVKKTMDELSYEYVDGQNILTMKKELA